jgi:hypothetical protein
VTSARKIKQGKVKAVRHFLAAWSVGLNGHVEVYLPGRRKPIALLKSEVELIQAMLASRDLQASAGCEFSLDSSLETCRIDTHA